MTKIVLRLKTYGALQGRLNLDEEVQRVDEYGIKRLWGGRLFGP